MRRLLQSRSKPSLLRLLSTATVALCAIGAASAVNAQVSVGARFERPPCSDGTPVSDAVRQTNLRVARAFVLEGLATGDLTAFDRYIAPDVWVSTGLKPGAPIVGRDEYKQVVASTLGVALSAENADMNLHEALVTVDGRVIIRFAAHADQTGTLHGVPPTNRRLTLAETHLFCLRDGLIVENYVGGLNPLQWEMIYSRHIASEVLP